ncbi:PH domain-containing protein OS=Streptomyces microflavus OX=1919 GN=Smic_13880 PE=4 SV=1 [Streptomyces microflavus]
MRTGSGPSARTFIQLIRQDSRAVTLQAPVDLAENPDHRFLRAHAVVRSTWEERCAGGTP